MPLLRVEGEEAYSTEREKMAAEGGPNGPDPGGTLISGRFRPTKRLGSGSFGEIYMGVGTSGEKVAIKFEKAGLRCPQLRHEYKVFPGWGVRRFGDAPVPMGGC